MNLKKYLPLALLVGAVGLVWAGVTYPYYHSQWFGTGTKHATAQFSIQTPSAGASAIFAPGVTNTNDLGSSSLEFRRIYTKAMTLSGGTGAFLVTPPSAETIASGGTITANGCGTIKRITSPSAITTDTTNTFTAPSSANAGCIMFVVNSGTSTITLDNNSLFFSTGAANVALTGNDGVSVGSDGSAWYQLGGVSVN